MSGGSRSLAPTPPLVDPPPDCRLCGRCEGRARVVRGLGSGTAVLAVALSPPRDGDLTGLAFEGPAEEYIKRLFIRAGLTRENARLTYLVKCWGEAPPRAPHVDACRRFLWEEVKAFRPALILAMGAPVARLLLKPQGRFRVEDELGRTYGVSWSGGVVAPWLSPEAAFRAGRETDERLVRLLRGEAC